jgi:hypothetical protein
MTMGGRLCGVAMLTVLCVACGSSSRRIDVGPKPSTSTMGARVTNANPFVGRWWAHDGGIQIKPDMTGAMWSNCGGAVCIETDQLSLARSAKTARLTATITKRSYASKKGAHVAGPDPRESPAVGDSFYLEFVAPHLMKMTMIRSAVPWLGNPYLCGDGLPAARQHLCGG